MIPWLGAAETAPAIPDELIDEVNRINSESLFTVRGDDSYWKLIVAGALIAACVWLLNWYAKRKKQEKSASAASKRPTLPTVPVSSVLSAPPSHVAPRPIVPTPAPTLSSTSPSTETPASESARLATAAGPSTGADDAPPAAAVAETRPLPAAARTPPTAGSPGMTATVPLPPPAGPPPPPPPPAGGFIPEHTRMLRPGERVLVRFPGGRGHWEAALMHNDERAAAFAYTREPARGGRPARPGELVTGHLPMIPGPARLFVTQASAASPSLPSPPGNWLWIHHADIVRDDE